MNINPNEVGYVYTAKMEASMIAVLSQKSSLSNSKVSMYMGFRQLSQNEINMYTLDNPPPNPYNYRDQINNTALHRIYLTSCLSLPKWDDKNWNSDDCHVKQNF